MSAQNRQNLDTDLLRQRLKLRSFNSELALRKNHPQADDFFQKVGLRPGKIRNHAAKFLSSGVLAGSLLLSSAPVLSLPEHSSLISESHLSLDTPVFLQFKIAQDMKAILPSVGQWNLSKEQEEKMSHLIWDVFGVKARAEIDGNRMNFNYGRMGAEQHLARFPGDVVENMAPGLGGWGYVSDFEVEKYYVAVPIIYLPDWRERIQYYVNWYKFRRMLVVNPANGKAIVTAVADAGPSDWTGKHFGGSPEVMAYLGINYGMQNHPVTMFFLDDPNHEIPLGPVEYNIEKNKQVLSNKS